MRQGCEKAPGKRLKDDSARIHTRRYPSQMEDSTSLMFFQERGSRVLPSRSRCFQCVPLSRMPLNVKVDHVCPFLHEPLISMPWNTPLRRTPPSFSLQGPPACRATMHARNQDAGEVSGIGNSEQLSRAKAFLALGSSDTGPGRHQCRGRPTRRRCPCGACVGDDEDANDDAEHRRRTRTQNKDAEERPEQPSGTTIRM